MPAEIDGEARARALTALAAGESVSAAARAASYTRQHLHRLLKDAAFLAELEARRAELAEGKVAAGGPAEGELASLEREALAHIRELARDGDDPKAPRVPAISVLLRHVIACRGRAPRSQVKVRVEEGADGSRAGEVTAKGPAVDRVAGLLDRL